jgi:hypothetical protein
MGKKIIGTLFVFSFAAFVLNATYVSYPDEFVNIRGGQAILQGKVPYIQYFDHHMPLAWYLAALINLVSQANFIVFRIVFAVFQWGVFALLGVWIWRHHRAWILSFVVWLFLYAVSSVYFWIHLFLGDSLAVIFFCVTFWILVVQTLDRVINIQALRAATLSNFCLIWSSLTYVYLALILYIWVAVLVVKDLRDRKKDIRHWPKDTSLVVTLFTIIAPYIVYLVYLVSTGSVRDFLYANVTYNTRYYISLPDYTTGTRFNPVRLAITIAHNFWTAYLKLIAELSQISFYQPIAKVIGIGTVIFPIIIGNVGWVFGVLSVLLLTFTAPRSQQLVLYNEADYQIGLFVVFGLACASIILSFLYRATIKHPHLQLASRIVWIMLTVYVFCVALFLTFNTFSIWYRRYMGALVGIQNYSPVADDVDRFVRDTDTVWVGPYEPHVQYFLRKTRHVGKFPSLLPPFGKSTKLQKEFIAELEREKPAVIFFKNAGLLGSTSYEYGDFFLQWLKRNYATCENKKHACSKSAVVGFKPESEIHIRNDLFSTYLPKLQKDSK